MYHRMSGKSLKCPRFQAEIESCSVQWSKILDVPVLEKAERLAEVPKIVSQDRIQQRTVEQTVGLPVPQDVEEPTEFFKASSQDRVQQRSGGQIIEPPAILSHSLRRSLRYPSFRRKKRRNRV